MNSSSIYKLSNTKLWVIFLYLIVLFIFSTLSTIIALNFETCVFISTMPITLIAIIGGLGSAILGNTIFYIRKLYKICIRSEVEKPSNDNGRINEFGIFLYFITRPLFAIGFSLLIHISLKSSVNFITVRESMLDSGFIYLNMILSFIGGFATGDLITFIEEKSKKVINN